MKVYLTILLLCVLQALSAQDYNCSQHNYKLNDTLFVWKSDGIEFKNEANKSSKLISLISEYEKVIVGKKNNIYSMELCFKDTISNTPLLVISSPYVKVRYNGKTGYVLEHFVSKSPPFNLLNYLEGVGLTFTDKISRPGDFSESYEKVEIFKNGVITREFFDGKVTSRSSTLIPFIDHTTFLLVASKFLDIYGNGEDEKPGTGFIHELNHGVHSFNWFFEEDFYFEEITLSMNEFGMTIIKYSQGS